MSEFKVGKKRWVYYDPQSNRIRIYWHGGNIDFAIFLHEARNGYVYLGLL